MSPTPPRPSTLAAAFASYLGDPTPAATEALADALRQSGYGLEAELLQAGSGSGPAWPAIGPWTQGTVWRGSRMPPEAQVGDLWFDLVELTPMVLAGWPPDPDDADATPTGPHAWVAMRPVAVWQYAGFLARARVVERDAQMRPGLALLDHGRILAGPEPAPVRRLTHGEADLYARWFGKQVASWSKWEGATASLEPPARDALLATLELEWAGHVDEDGRVLLNPLTLIRGIVSALDHGVTGVSACSVLLGAREAFCRLRSGHAGAA